MSVRGFFVSFFSKKNQDLGGAKGDFANKAKWSSNFSRSAPDSPRAAQKCIYCRSVPISVLLAARSLSSCERLSSRSIRQSRTHDGKRKCTADLHLASSTDANGFHARTWLPARRPIPLPVCARLPPELGFRRRYAIFVMCRVVARASR